MAVSAYIQQINIKLEMSKHIYENKIHYVYQITNIITNIKYIGARTSKYNNILYDLKKYKSSTTLKIFEKDQKENPHNYKYEILSCFDTRKAAIDEEIRLHALYKVKTNKEYYNLAEQKSNGFDATGFVAAKDENNNVLWIDKEDERYLSGELVSINKGKVVVKDTDGNILQVDITNERFLSGELVSIAKGKVVVKDEDGNNITVQSDDPRLKTGELVGVNTGKCPVRDKNGNTFLVNCDDERFLSGELISTALGLIAVRDKKGNTYKVSKDDPRYLSGELVGVNTGKITINNGTINKFIYKNEAIPEGWVKGMLKKKKSA